MYNRAEQHMWVRRDVVGTLARPRRRWMDDIKMDIKGIGRERVQQIDMAQDRGKWWVFAIARNTLLVP
jgi:hypothetical protein